MRWNQSASIQARVYDELYSSFGLSRPLADRESSVAALSSELQILIDVRAPLSRRDLWKEALKLIACAPEL